MGPAPACVHRCYARRAMERIGIRELRNDVSRVVRRAKAGERLVVTVDGVPAAQIGPLTDRLKGTTVEDLVAAGLLRPPLAASRPPSARPVKAPPGRTTTELLREHRDR